MKKLLVGLAILLVLTGCSSVPKGAQEESESVFLYLIRHGETVYNLEGKAQGFSDSPLTELGKEQAELLGGALKDIDFNQVITSPSPRAVNTTKLVMGDKDYELVEDKRNMEMNFGSLEEGPGELLWQNGIDETFEKGWTEWGGEDFEILATRVMAALDDIVKNEDNLGKNVLLSSHGMTILSVLYEVDEVAADTLTGGLDNCSITIIEYKDGKFNLVKMNDTSYLD